MSDDSIAVLLFFSRRAHGEAHGPAMTAKSLHGVDLARSIDELAGKGYIGRHPFHDNWYIITMSGEDIAVAIRKAAQ